MVETTNQTRNIHVYWVYCLICFIASPPDNQRSTWKAKLSIGSGSFPVGFWECHNSPLAAIWPTTWVRSQVLLGQTMWKAFGWRKIGPTRSRAYPKDQSSEGWYTLWLFNIAMENGPFIGDFPIKTSIYKGFSMAMLNNQMVICLWAKQCLFFATQKWLGNFVTIYYVCLMIRGIVYDIVSPTFRWGCSWFNPICLSQVFEAT